MTENWKDKPHWVLLFDSYGKWELTAPDGEVKIIEGFGQRNFSVRLGLNQVPEFDMDGILILNRPRRKP